MHVRAIAGQAPCATDFLKRNRKVNRVPAVLNTFHSRLGLLDRGHGHHLDVDLDVVLAIERERHDLVESKHVVGFPVNRNLVNYLVAYG